jgi:hypothetical protein
MKTKLMSALALILCLVLVACSTSQIAVSLNVAAFATSAASTTIANVTSIDSTLRSQIATYLSATSTALNSAARLMKGGTVTAADIASITATLSNAVLPALPDSVPAPVKTAVGAVTAAVQSFLSLLSQQQATSTASASRLGGLRIYHLSLTHKDKSLIGDSLKYLTDADAALATVPR